MIDRVETRDLPPVVKNRLHLRKAGIWAGLAYQRARHPEIEPTAVQTAAARAIDELAAVDKSELMESDAAAYSDAAIRVGASRWGSAPGTPSATDNGAGRGPGKVAVVTTPGQPGETCIHLVDAKCDAKNPLLTRCTYGIVWPAAATVDRYGSALALAVQPLDTWREMWVFRQRAAGWTVAIVPPGLDAPNLGYVEFAGWVRGATQMLAAREIRIDGRYKQSFKILRLDGLQVERWADKPSSLSLFYRWQDPVWKGQTVSVR